jgi:hypothetical protein
MQYLRVACFILCYIILFYILLFYSTFLTISIQTTTTDITVYCLQLVFKRFKSPEMT